jgi:EAL domain-containing protein (putative c-di-GMP-specific phosphodiesterase class I)
VETRTDCHLLTSMGCDRIQGYIVDKPLEGHEFLRWMVDRRDSKGREALVGLREMKLFGT